MPSTLTGILILLVSFAPGYVYLLQSERQGAPLRTVSAFRETAQVILTSFLALSGAAVTFAMIKLLIGDHALDVKALAINPDVYWRDHVFEVVGWGAGLLLLACTMSYLWGAHTVGSRLAELSQHTSVGRFVWPPSTTSFTSAWTLMLEVHEPDLHKYVKARLSDGTLVQGWMSSFNPHVSETGDRELTLANPVHIAAPDGTVTANDGGAVALSARNILYLEVDFHPNRALDPGTNS